MNNNNLLSFTKSCTSLLKSGLTIQETLEICGKADKKLSFFCNLLEKEIYNGNSLSNALTKCSYMKIPAFYSLLVKIGEDTGSMPEIFSELTIFLQNQKKIKEKTIQALIYPILVLFMTIILGIFIMFYIYPKMKSMLDDFSGFYSNTGTNEMLFPVKIISFVLILILLILLGSLIARKNNLSIKFSQDSFLLNLPVIGRYIKVNESRRFCFAMKILCSSGISFLTALEECPDTVTNIRFSNEIKNMAESIKRGMSPADFAAKNNVFPSEINTWLMIGQKTGNSGEIFSELYTFYDEEYKKNEENLERTLEPLLIIISGSVLVLFILNFVVPVFMMLGNVL
jgi:type II secretory pathway component PulF